MIVQKHEQHDYRLWVRDLTGVLADDGPVFYAGIGQTIDMTGHDRHGEVEIGSFRSAEGGSFGASRLAAVDGALTEFVAMRL